MTTTSEQVLEKLKEAATGQLSRYIQLSEHLKSAPQDAAARVAMTFDFGLALACLKAGIGVARRGWPHDMVLWLHASSHDDIITVDYLVIQCDEVVMPWGINQTDVLARDWYVVVGAFEERPPWSAAP